MRSLRVLRGYVFWTYERGSLHYDVMVTLILLFLFLSPHWIDFHDRPIPAIPNRASELLVRPTGDAGRRFMCEIRADDLAGAHTDAERQNRIQDIVRNIAGDVQILSVKPVTDPHGQIVAYDATAMR